MTAITHPSKAHCIANLLSIICPLRRKKSMDYLSSRQYNQ